MPCRVDRGKERLEEGTALPHECGLRRRLDGLWGGGVHKKKETQIRSRIEEIDRGFK